MNDETGSRYVNNKAGSSLFDAEAFWGRYKNHQQQRAEFVNGSFPLKET